MTAYQPQRRKRHTGLRIFAFASLGLLLIVIIAVAASGGGKTGGTPAATSATTSPAAAATPAAAAAPKPHVIARFAGSGIESTRQFTIGGAGSWVLRWSYNCAAFGQSGNFQVDEDKGGADFNGANVNELGRHGHGLTHVYSDAGRHFLEVDSECSWRMRVVGQ